MPDYHPSDREHEIARRTLEIIPFVMRIMAAEMRQTDYPLSSGHVPVLESLALRSHTTGELAERLSVSAPTMSNTISTLEKRGWVSRHRSSTDRRRVDIEITQQGQQVLHDIHDHVEMRLAGLLDTLTDDDGERLLEGLTILRDVFAAAIERDPDLREEDSIADTPHDSPSS